MRSRASLFIVLVVILVAWLPTAQAGLIYNITNTVNVNGNPFHIGQDSTNDVLTISGVGVLTNISLSKIGNNSPDHTNNVARIIGPAARWYVAGELSVGYASAKNSMIITNGGLVHSGAGEIGNNIEAVFNAVRITGAGSRWTNSDAMNIGHAGSRNSLSIDNGGNLSAGIIRIGYGPGSSNNSVTVSGSASTMSADILRIGHNGQNNRLTITNSARVYVNNVVIGLLVDSSNNLLNVSGGSLLPNGAGGGQTLDVRRGAFIFNGGEIITEEFRCSSVEAGATDFRAGVLRTRDANYDNGSPFVVGDGVRSATYNMLGGTNIFADGMVVSGNAILNGNGYASDVTIKSGGTMSPGQSVGYIATSNLTLEAGAKLVFELGPTNGSDRVVALDTLSIDGQQWSDFNFTNLAGYAAGRYVLIDAQAIVGALGAVTNGTLAGVDSILSVDVVNSDLVLDIGEPQLEVSPLSLDFGGVQIGSSATLSFIVTNSGSSQLEGTALLGGLPFSIIEGSGFSVGIGGYTNVTITFTPTDILNYSDDVVFQSNGGGSTNALAGYGFIVVGSTGTAVNVSGGVFDFNFAIQSGALYRVQATVDLLDPAGWQDITAPLTNRTGDLLNFPDPDTSLHPWRMYRISSP